MVPRNQYLPTGPIVLFREDIEHNAVGGAPALALFEDQLSELSLQLVQLVISPVFFPEDDGDPDWNHDQEQTFWQILCNMM